MPAYDSPEFKREFRVLPVLPAWCDEAWETARKRREFHAALGSERHWTDVKKGEYGDEYYGSLAQIVFRERLLALEDRPACEFAPLYTDDLSKMPDWDALVEGKTVDVKAVPPSDKTTRRARMLVKISEFKRLDFYVAVKFWDEGREYSICGAATGAQVADKAVVNFGFADCHAFYIDELPVVLDGKWWLT